MRAIWKILIGLGVVLCIGIALCYTMLPAIVSHAIEKDAEVEVDIGSIQLGFSEIGMSRFRMGNPPGSILPHALTIDKMKATVPASHFFRKTIVIPTLDLNSVYVGLEFNSKRDHKGNWTYIMKNLNDSNTSGDSDTEVLIKRLTLRNVTVAIVYKDNPKNIKTVNIPSLEFTDVSSKGGIPAAQITQLVMRYALQQIFSKENLQNMIQDILSPNQGGFFQSFRSLFSLELQYKGSKEGERDEISMREP